jgi:protein O-GlcNAc transferase
MRAWMALVALALCAGCAERATAPETLPEPPAVSLDGLTGSAAASIGEALAAFRVAPKDADANGALAMALDAQGRLDGAVTYYDRARRLAPGSLRWNHLLGLALLAQGRPAEAADALRRALAADPGNAPSRRALAEALLAQGLADDSRQEYEALLAVNPVDPRALHGLGRALALQGDAEGALLAFERAVAAAPAFAAARYDLALAYRDAGRADDSARQMRLYEANRNAAPPAADPLRAQVTALRADPTHRLARAAEMENAGDLEGALAEHLAALKEDPEMVQAHINLVALYGRLSRGADARASYRQALELSPDRAELHYNLGVLELTEGHVAEAERAFSKAVELNPDYAAALINLGQTLEARRAYAQAAPLYARAVAARPDDLLARYHHGRMLLGNGQAREAIAQFEAALEPENPRTAEVLFALAAARAQLGERDEARRAAERALALAQRDGRADLARAVEYELEKLR